MFVCEHLLVSLGNREITPHGGACLYASGMRGLHSLAGGLLDEWSQHVEGQRGIFFQAVGRHRIECIDEVTRQHTRKMHLASYCRGGTIDPAAQGTGYALDL